MAHTLAYSLIGLQEMNLAYKYPIIFWDTANLIVDSGSMNLEEVINLEDTDNEDEDDEKIKNSSCDYGKVASAIGKMKARGLNFSLPDINKSDITFSPNLKDSQILYGLRGITRIGNQLVKDIIKNRPYVSLEDFTNKIKVNKQQMINLVKAGLFDHLYPNETREQIMHDYIESIADKKKRITLQNMQMLITKNLIPEELSKEKALFNFNKYLKQFKDGDYYTFNAISFRYFSEHYPDVEVLDLVISPDDITGKILQKTWDSIYKKDMEPVRAWMKEKQDEILHTLNNTLFAETAEKYTEGNISKWEMDSLSFYYHDHELAGLKNEVYQIDDYFDLPKEPEIENTFPSKDGGVITIYKIHRIAGTVIDKDKNKNMITLLTPSGVVVVKIWKSQFASWDKQISAIGADGKKHIIEKSWFTRGNKLIITGIKRDDTFIPKKYKNTEFPLFEKIEELDDKGFILKSSTERVEEE